MNKATNIKDIINNNINGATFISMTTSTDPRLTGGKANPHKGAVEKIMVGANVMIFQNKTINSYDAMVKRRLEKEGKDPTSFSLSPRTWGTRIPNTPFVEHKGEYYLEVIFLHTGKVHYELNGKMIHSRNVRGLPKSVDGGHQGGLNDKVIIRTFKVSSITSLVINGEEYTDLEYK